jgi:Family of unknown function (DUF6868)
MSIVMVRDALLWCAIINFGLLAVGSLLFVLSHEWLHGLWSKRFRLPVDQFDAINFAAIVLYKTGIILFNLTPYIALRIAGWLWPCDFS